MSDTARTDIRDSLARAIQPADWRLRDDPRYAHLPPLARDALVGKSREHADAALAWLETGEGAQLDVVTMPREDFLRLRDAATKALAYFGRHHPMSLPLRVALGLKQDGSEDPR